MTMSRHPCMLKLYRFEVWNVENEPAKLTVFAFSRREAWKRARAELKRLVAEAREATT